MSFRVLARRTAFLCALACSLTLTSCSKKPDKEPSFQVAAAADLALAFGELGKAFAAEHHVQPVFTFGSTGLLAKQIGEGAPFSMFAAANESFVNEVVGKGKCDKATARRYARGRIVVWTTGAIKPPTTLAELADPRFKRIAIANPEHAPYGKAAKQALEASGLWEQLQPRLVLGDNVRATLQFAQTGNVDAAIVALSLSVATDGGSALPIDQALHQPLDQALVVCAGGDAKQTEQARRFAEYVTSKEGQEVLTRYGFGVPAAPGAEPTEPSAPPVQPNQPPADPAAPAPAPAPAK
jgi:molybdate transport system substrate-binding protein